MTKKIPLTQGKFATVSDCDFERLSKFKWHAVQKRNGRFYAARKISGSSKREYMHIVILPGHEEVDHIDGDSLNNTRLNLRGCTRQQNSWNSKKYSSNTSGYKGVSFDSRIMKYRACIKVNGKNVFLGVYRTAEEAARVFDSAAVKYRGEFASVNFHS